MAATVATEPSTMQERGEQLVERLFTSVLGFNEVCLVHIGERLGLYRALAAGGPASAPELAARTELDERYVREWLEAQAVSGILEVDDTAAPAQRRHYSLPPAHERVLTDIDDPLHMAAFARMMVGLASPIEQVIEAFRSGDGVAYADYGSDFCEGQGVINRVGFVNELGSSWLPALGELHERLGAMDAPRIVDVACGTGWSTIALARTYPNATVVGADLDMRSIGIAHENVQHEDLGDRITMRCIDAAELRDERGYDLATVFEAIHDMSDPVAVLSSIRELLAPEGVLLVADERVQERFTAPGDQTEQLMYGWSVLHCLPVGRAQQPSVATGTVMRPATLERYAEQAGFRSTEVLPIEHDFWRFYLLRR